MCIRDRPYTPHEVENARRQYELPPKVKTVVRCAKGQLGVAGDNTWGAGPHAEYLSLIHISHSVGRRVAVKAGCKPVHFSLDGYPLSCYFSGSVATTSGHFVHKSERRTRDGGFHIRPVC